jgi:hypothetical protein
MREGVCYQRRSRALAFPHGADYPCVRPRIAIVWLSRPLRNAPCCANGWQKGPTALGVRDAYQPGGALH